MHRDVIDAMIRQPFSNETKPWHTNTVRSGSVIDAVDYDLGVNGSAYYDLDTGNYYISGGNRSEGNKGRMYRNDGVDIYAVPRQKGKYYVGSIEDGEWLQYTMDIVQGGKYDIELFVSADRPGGLLTLTDAGVPIAENIKVPETGSVQPAEKIILKNIPLRQGSHRFRLLVLKGGFNFYSMTFKYKSHL